MTFTELLDNYLVAREAVQVSHGPLYEQYLAAKQELDNFFGKPTHE